MNQIFPFWILEGFFSSGKEMLQKQIFQFFAFKNVAWRVVDIDHF